MPLDQQWASVALSSGAAVPVPVHDAPDAYRDWATLEAERARRGDNVPLIAVEPSGFARCCLLPSRK
jgi:hypothetical protein